MLDILKGLLWLLVGACLAQLVEIFLPERIRVWFTLKKKTLSKWIRNPSYAMGITSRLDFKESLESEIVKKRIRGVYAGQDVTTSAAELHFREVVGKGQINVRIQLAYDEDTEREQLFVYSLNVTVETHAQYRDIICRIEDLRGTLSAVEAALIKDLPVFPAKRALYIEVEKLAEFSEWLENLEARQITGKIRDAEAEFVYHDRRLLVENTINSATISWLKNIVAHVG